MAAIMWRNGAISVAANGGGKRPAVSAVANSVISQRQPGVISISISAGNINGG